ncbi:unnamed protein product [Urochloa humidicola]
MAAAATLARALRGGRRSGAGAGSLLLLPQIPGIGSRAPLEHAHAAGPLLPRLGAAGGAGGIFRRMLSQPIDSLDVLLDLQERVYKMGREAHLLQNRCKALYIMPAVGEIIGLLVWCVVKDHESNKTDLKKLKVSVEETEINVNKLRRSIHELNN